MTEMNLAEQTDRQALDALLARFGLTPADVEPAGDGGVEVTLGAQWGGVTGYTGFCAIFGFDADGKFTELGIWE